MVDEGTGRFYTKTLSHTGTSNDKIVYDKEGKFKFNRSSTSTGLFLPVMNQLAEENNLFKSALKELREIGDYQEFRINELTEENDYLRKVLEDVLEEYLNNCHDYDECMRLIDDLKSKRIIGEVVK